MQRIEQKCNEELPTLRHFLENVKEIDGKSKYQGIILKDFDHGNERAHHAKTGWVSVIACAIHDRLENENESVVSKTCGSNTEGWFSL